MDGPGIRYTIFVQGCPHHCPGCHNPQTHDFAGGYLADPKVLLEEIRKNPLLSGVTFSGGEPFCQPEALADLGREIKKLGGFWRSEGSARRSLRFWIFPIFWWTAPIWKPSGICPYASGEAPTSG